MASKNNDLWNSDQSSTEEEDSVSMPSEHESDTELMDSASAPSSSSKKLSSKFSHRLTIEEKVWIVKQHAGYMFQFKTCNIKDIQRDFKKQFKKRYPAYNTIKRYLYFRLLIIISYN